MKYAIALVMLLAALSPARASEYTYNDGYYWRDGVAYNRTDNGYWYKLWHKVPSCNYGCGYYWSYTWEWYPKYTYTAVKLDYNAPDIEEQIIALAKARDKAVLAIAAKQQKSQAALALVDKLGLAGNFNVANYGNGLFSAGQYQSAAAYQAQQGATVFGLATFKQTKDAYGQLDPNAPLQQYGLAVQSALELGKQSVGGLQTVVQDVNAGVVAQSQGNARVNETLAKGQAVATAAAGLGPAVQAAPSTHTRTESTVPVEVAPAVPPALPLAVPPKQETQALRTLPADVLPHAEWLKLPGPAACISCHGKGGRSVASFDLMAYHPATASADLRDKVQAYLSVADGKGKGCPKKAKLTDAQKLQFVVVPKVPATSATKE